MSSTTLRTVPKPRRSKLNIGGRKFCTTPDICLDVGNSATSIGEHPGTYALLIKLDGPISIRVGKLGILPFSASHYCYVGSAMNGLRARVARHLRSDKRTHWHIDYLLEQAKIVEVLWCYSEERLECRVAQGITARGLASVQGFGASDCRCPSHLFYHRDISVLRQTVEASFHPTPSLVLSQIAGGDR